MNTEVNTMISTCNIYDLDMSNPLPDDCLMKLIFLEGYVHIYLLVVIPEEYNKHGFLHDRKLLQTEICDVRTSGTKRGKRARAAAVRNGLRSAVRLGFSYTSLVSCASLRY